MATEHVPNSSWRRGSLGVVVHTIASEVESVSGGKTVDRSSFIIQQDETGRRRSVLGAQRPEALAANLSRNRRSSIGAEVLLQVKTPLAKLDDHQEEEEDDEDEVWWDGKSDIESGEEEAQEAEDEAEYLEPETVDPLAPEHLLALAEMLDRMVQTKTDSDLCSVSQEQTALLQRIVKSASCLVHPPSPGSKERRIHATYEPFNKSVKDIAQRLEAEHVRKNSRTFTESGSKSEAEHIRNTPQTPTQSGSKLEAEHIRKTSQTPTESRSNVQASHRSTLQFAPAQRGGVEQAEDDGEAEKVAPVIRKARKAQTAAFRTCRQMNPEKAGKYFKQFLEAKQVVEIEDGFENLLKCCDILRGEFPHTSMSRLPGLPWKAAKVWSLFQSQAEKKDYSHKKLAGQSVAVVGAGPVGLRVAMELALSGATVTVIEKRSEFSRINRLHLWDWVKQDLVSWGAKIFSPPGGNFGADKDYCHIGISELQTLLLKCCLLLGVTVELGVEFEGTKFSKERGWTLETTPSLLHNSRVKALICCDGAASRIATGYGAKVIAGGLGKAGQAIGVVANFVNERTKEERDRRQFSWARQFNVPLFSDVKFKTGADLENIVYYRGDENHYVIMTPTKRCLVDSGCLKESEPKGIPLLHASNVEMDNLQEFAKSVASYFDLPTSFTPSQSVMAFDFSDTHRHEQAVTFVDADGADSPLPVCLAGDALLEPFWPTGLGCVRGFLSALDCVSTLKKWVETGDRKAVLCYSDAAYSQLKSVEGQTKDAILKPDHEWRLDPSTRYRQFSAK